MGTMPTITVLGNFSGRNAGDAAILGNLLHDIHAVRRDVRFLVPTARPAFVARHFGDYPVTPLGMMPWNLALKNLGWPMLRAMLWTDMVLITDNILFDRELYNPAFNYLYAISLCAPLARRRRIPVMLYNASLGPIGSAAGARALQRVMDASPLSILRDEQSEQLLRRLGLRYPRVLLHADCAINTVPSPAERMAALIRREGLFSNPGGTIGFNVNAYMDGWSGQGTFSREAFLQEMAAAADQVVARLGVDLLFIVSQLMDMENTQDCMARMRHRDRARMVTNAACTYADLAGLLARVELHVGLRTHPLIFSAAVGTPMLNINSYPKSAGFMASIGQQRWQIECRGLKAARLVELILQAWEARAATRAALRRSVPVEQEKARRSARIVCEMLR
jgi:polysaccharide pyruvyl transferase WcaK-like protein